MCEPIRILCRARILGLILLLEVVASCSAWHPLPGANLANQQSEPLGHAKVFLRDGTELELRDATIRSDSIIGFGGDAHARLAVTRTDVVRVDALQPDALKTVLAGALLTVSLTFLYVATVVALLYGDHD
jgi:hypothetical protein